jgi:hypothetical protein
MEYEYEKFKTYSQSLLIKKFTFALESLDQDMMR